jgi:hypothetical protein
MKKTETVDLGALPKADESKVREALDVIEQAGAAVDDKLEFHSRSEQKRLTAQQKNDACECLHPLLAPAPGTRCEVCGRTAPLADALFPEAPRPWTVKKITGYTDGRSKKRSEFTRGYDVFDAQENPVARFYDKSDAERVCDIVNDVIAVTALPRKEDA